MTYIEKNALNAMVEVARLAASTQQVLARMVEAGVEGRVMVSITQGKEDQQVWIRADVRTQHQITPLFDVARTEWYGDRDKYGALDAFVHRDYWGRQRNIEWMFNDVSFYMVETEGDLRRMKEQDETDQRIDEETRCSL
tara:strand:+ start:291 stop:707 length:417 start_codon:yes stop_codon:yes gene_type:complete